MFDIVIRRCPHSKQIGDHAAEVYASLLLDFDRNIRIEDGERDEFSLLIEGFPAMLRSIDSLPSVEEVEAAIQRTTPMSYAPADVRDTCVQDTDLWLDRPIGDEG